MTTRRFAAFACFAISVVAVAVAGCGGGETASRKVSAPKCPFISDYPYWDLPKRMSRVQVAACQRYFARYTPGKRFFPGARGFSSAFCEELYRRTQNDRHGECQTVRNAVCRLAVRDGKFQNMRECVAASPPMRVILREKPRITALVSEPAAFDGIWLRSNVLDEWFTDPDFRIEFHGPERDAWDSRLVQVVPFPSDLTEHVAQSPDVRVIDRRTVDLGGRQANQIDFFVNNGDANARHRDMCGEEFIRDVPCLPITADPNDEGYVSWWLDPGSFYRLIDVSTPSGRVVISIDVDDAGEFEATGALLSTLRFG